MPKHLFSNGGLARVLHMQEAELNFLALALKLLQVQKKLAV
jgi:hypothetical protein